MFGILYSLIAGTILTGSYIKSSIEDIGNKAEAEAKGEYKYIDSQGRVRRVDNNRLIRERVRKDGELVDLDLKTGEILYTYPNKEKIRKQKRYEEYLKSCQRTNELHKKFAIKFNYKQIRQIYPRDYESWSGIMEDVEAYSIDNEFYKEK